MNIYKRRIGFLISDQHLIPHGGIGQFAKGFVEMAQRIGWKVDLIVDKTPTNEFANYIRDLGANIVFPNEPLSYADHTAAFVYNDSINFEKIVNFRKSTLKAFETNIYDLLICNTQEAMSATYALALGRYIPVMFYTHLHSMIFREAQNFADVFLESYHTFYNKHMEFDNIVIGTQTQKNFDELSKYGATNIALLSMPMSERKLLEEYNGEKKGVLFIGRWEEGKNPEAFIKVIKDTGLPARVLTNRNGKKKFVKRFSEEGITDYEIKAGVVGDEKVDFIRSSKVHFNPSLRENYPFAFFECLGHAHCLVLDSQDWSTNFDSRYYHRVSMQDAPNKVKELYDQDQNGHIQYVRDLDSATAKGWIDFLDNWIGSKSKSNAAKINEHTTVCYREFIESLGRKHLAQEDIVSVLNNRHKFRVIYTDQDTYLTKEPSFVPESDQPTGASLFEGFD